MSSSLDQALWLAKRLAPPRRRYSRWTPEKLARLEAMVGKLTVPEMGRELGLPAPVVSTRLNQLGYSIRKDINEPLGLNLHKAAQRLGIPYEWLWHRVRAGSIRAPKKDKKDYLLRWREYRRIERQIAAHTARRERWLAHIKEPVITKKQFDRLIGLSETQCHRYLKGRIVRAWKIPMPWAGDANRNRWEWRVSKADAERVARLRAEGRLKLRRKAFREIVARENAKVTWLRKARRLGGRDDLKHKLSCVVPGCYTIAQVASHVGLSESEVYQHISIGRLKAEHKRVGNRTYVAVHPEDLEPYLAWTRREKKHTGPIHGRRRESEAVIAAGYLTITASLEHYPDLTPGALRSAVDSGRIPSRRIGRMIALKQKDVRAYVKIRRRWAEMKAKGRRL